MKTELVASNFAFDDESASALPTTRVDLWLETVSPHARSAAVPDLAGYSYALEDLEDLAHAPASDDSDVLNPSEQAVGYAHRAIRAVAGAYPPPEVTARDNGTILLLWHDERGFISIEIGDEKFGLVSSRRGFPSVCINDENRELERQLPRRTVAAIEAPDRQSIRALTTHVSILGAVKNAVTRIKLDGEPGVATA